MAQKVFIIEDDEDLRENMTDLLTMEGYKVFGYHTGKNVMNMLLEIQPDIIICDIMLPGMDGFQIIEEVRKSEILCNIPFVFLTALVEMKDLRQGMNLGANDYLLKPYEAKELINTVKLRLSMSHAKNSSAHSVSQTTKTTSDTVLVNTTNSVKSIKLSNIVYISGDAEYSELFLNDKTKLHVRKLMKEWEELLPESRFLRIHKSIIINLDHLLKAEKWFNNSFRIFMQSYPEALISSRRYSIRIRQKLIG